MPAATKARAPKENTPGPLDAVKYAIKLTASNHRFVTEQQRERSRIEGVHCPKSRIINEVLDAANPNRATNGAGVLKKPARV